MSKFSDRFKQAIVTVLNHEGGYVNHPADPGGETKFGITKRRYPNEDIKNLTVERAKELYYRDFWKTGPYEQIDSFQLAAKVFDTAVNTGPRRAFITLQVAANSCGLDLIVDGVVGPKTLEGINSLKEDMIMTSFRNEQEQWYRRIVHNNPSQSVFLKGWLRRAAS